MEKKKILIVEDERIIAESTKFVLQSYDFDVCGIADSGDDALKQTEKHKPDLVLMDIRLRGDMDGIDVANEIYKRYGIYSFFITAFSSHEIIDRIKTAHALAYFEKPVEDNELCVNIHMALHKIEKRKII